MSCIAGIDLGLENVEPLGDGCVGLSNERGHVSEWDFDLRHAQRPETVGITDLKKNNLKKIQS